MTLTVDTLMINGRVLAGSDFQPTSALAILGGRIAALGADATDLPARQTVDLAGSTVVPGFHDAHNHMAWFGMTLTELDLTRTKPSTLEGLYAAVRERAAVQPANTWIIGNGYDQNVLGNQHPAAAGLDAVAPNHHVVLRHRSGHMSVVNSRVLAQLDLSQLPSGGDLGRDGSGTPTGLLREQAQLLLRPLLFPESVERVADAAAAASRVYLSQGLTSVTEAGIGGGWIGRTPVELAAYQRARGSGALKVRVTLMPVVDVLHSLDVRDPTDPAFGLDLGIRTGFGDDWLRIGAVKIFADGSLVGRTAAMFDPYVGGQESGYFQVEPARLARLVMDAHRAGWQLATHAIGDRAIDAVLDAYEAALARAPRPDHRHRIEHCAVTSPEQVSRIARLGVIPVPQGPFVTYLGDGMAAALGPLRTQWCYRQRSFLDSGIEIPGSSDRPVVDGDPLVGMRALVQRRTASGEAFASAEALTPGQALRAYTYGSARAAFAESRVGRIEVGHLADLAVLSHDPTTMSGLQDAQVVATIIDGTIAHDPLGLC